MQNKRFRYVLRNKIGANRKGVLEAESETDALRRLTEEGNSVLSMREEVEGWVPFWQKPHLSLEDKLIFTKHLGTMLRAGITITESLQILASQSENLKNREMLESMMGHVRAGQTLSETMKVYPNVFSDLFVNMIETGEKSGTLDQVLDYLDEQLDKEYELHKKVISAFIYPAVIMGVMMILCLGIVFFIMPKISKIFTSFDVRLPLPTRILIGLSTFLTTHPLLSFLITVVVIGLGWFLAVWKRIKTPRDLVILHLPVFGKVLKFSNLARFSRTLFSLLQAGLPVTRALTVIASMLDNQQYKNAVEIAEARVEQGGQLGEAFEGQEKWFPALTVKMLAVGERTGSLETTMKQLASLYERNVDNMTRNLTVLLEPILLVFMGALVGGVSISIILPIYQLPNLISR